MSISSMQNLVAAIQRFEDMGDQGVSIPGSASAPGALDGRSISFDNNSVQAQRQREILDGLVQTVRDTRGMDSGAERFVAQAFNSMSDSGVRSLSGREVAAVLSAALHGMEDFDAALRTGAIGHSEGLLGPAESRRVLEQFAAYIDGRPLDDIQESELPPAVAALSREQIQSFVAENTTRITPAAAPAPAAAAGVVAPSAEQAPLPTFAEALDALRVLRDRPEFGGAPHYDNGEPHQDAEARKFFGITYEAAYTYCSAKATDSKTLFPSFWKFCADIFRPRSMGNAPGELTNFERSFFTVTAAAALYTHREAISAAYARGAQAGDDALRSLTRLVPHTHTVGGPVLMARYAHEYPENFLRAFAEARTANRLEEFFITVNRDACLNARITTINSYLENRILARETAEAAAAAAATGAQQTEDPEARRVASRATSISDACAEALDAWIMTLPEEKREGPYNMDDLRAYLLGREDLAGREFTNIRGGNSRQVGERIAGFSMITAEALDSMVFPYFQRVESITFEDRFTSLGYMCEQIIAVQLGDKGEIRSNWANLRAYLLGLEELAGRAFANTDSNGKLAQGVSSITPEALDSMVLPYLRGIGMEFRDAPPSEA